MRRNEASNKEQPSSIMSSQAVQYIGSAMAGAALGLAGMGIWRLHDHVEDSMKASAARQQAIATLQKQAQAESQAARKPMLVPPNIADEPTLNPAQLFQPNQLPGYGMAVTPASEQALERSTVAVLARQKGADTGAWTLRCSGIKVDIDGTPFVLWPEDCDVPGANGAGFTASTQFQTKNVLAQSDDMFAIAQSAPNGAVTDMPIAPVTGEAVENYGATSLLSVTNTPAFAAVPAIPADALATALPVNGQAVETVYATNGQQVTATGTYVGDIGNIFIVGYTQAEDPHDNACSNDSLGASFVLSDGSVSGSLLWQYDKADATRTQPGSSISEYTYLEGRTGVDLAQFTQLCAYDQPIPSALIDLSATLEVGTKQ